MDFEENTSKSVAGQNGNKRAKIMDSDNEVDLKQEWIHSCLKIVADPVHGHIDLHPLFVKIIDTPEFQRLRFLKQLGGCYFVYPGGAHNRFEHSIGTCYLAGELIDYLMKIHKKLKTEITDAEILSVKIAALCHDLGHGPFSHLFDGRFIPAIEKIEKEKEKRENQNKEENKIKKTTWKHEEASVKMLDHLIAKNGLERDFSDFKIDGRLINMIKDFINPYRCLNLNGKETKEEKLGEMKDFLRKQGFKAFLYQIVSNPLNGIDVDKWDYFARDCHHLGIKNSFDHRRIIKYSRVVKEDGVSQICFRDKVAPEIYHMFYTREHLHRKAYQHKTNKIVEYMINEALVLADNNESMKVKGKDGKRLKMSEAVYDMEAYVKLDDSVFNRILYNNEDNDENMVEAKRILTKIMKRELYKFVGEVQLLDDDLNMEKLKKQIAEACPDLQDMFQENLIVEEALFDYGMKDKNPVDHVFFYRKSAPDVPVKIEKHEVSQMLPGVFIEKFLRVYWKKRDDTFGKIKDCFSEWKIDHMSKRNKHGS